MTEAKNSSVQKVLPIALIMRYALGQLSGKFFLHLSTHEELPVREDYPREATRRTVIPFFLQRVAMCQSPAVEH
jgi:hypothetical protein